MKLEIRRGRFAYDADIDVFRDINLEVADNEFLCILGPNGCGKTTLLKCLCGMMRLKEGEVLLDGKNIATLKRWEVASKIGYVPQENGNTFPFTVQQMVLGGRAPYISVFSSPSSRDIAIADEAMERVGIAGLKDKRFNELSGGEKQLVLIARALAQQPKILLLDEPTAHLDFRNQTLILRLIQRLAQEEGLSIIITTHVPDHAFAYSNRVALMHNGQFIAFGPPDEVMTEANLEKVYGIEIRVYTVVDKTRNKPIKLCVSA